MFGAFGNIAFLVALAPFIESANRLNEFISHFEPCAYNHRDLDAAHARARRSVSRDHVVHLAFSAHGRSYNVRLRRDLETFADSLLVTDHGGRAVDVEPSHVYRGHLIGEPDSFVFGSVSDGLFEGKIVSQEGNLYVERASRYFPADANVTFHSVVYKESDVQDPYEHVRTGHVGGCGITDSVSQWMEQIQNSATEEETEDQRAPDKQETDKHNNELPKKYKKDEKEERWRMNAVEENETPFEKYSRGANSKYGHSRNKRATRPKEENKNTCSLFIETDPLIWRHISDQVNGDPEKTREEILSLIAHHVTAVNYIYRDTKFDGRVEHRNIKFEVQRIKIDDDQACRPHYRGEPNPFCMENIDVSNFLNLHSLGNHEDFCLAYVFTYRDFTGGTLGLAWVASASGASGGICEKYKTYTETVGGMYQSTRRSLNTGIITFVNYNSRVPPKVSQLTLAHEIGHNFGSPHDYPSDCRPGGLSGNYIMFASATSGDRPNNSKFSSCSVGNISNVLDAIEDKKKRNCFEISEGAFCGNKIVEAGEECDCGYDDDECSDKCCYPRVVGESELMRNKSAKGCQRRYGTECSPSQGPCCNGDTCKFQPASAKTQCRQESDCAWQSRCDGRSAECPVSPPKQNKTRCNEGTQLCISGECRGSICLEWNLQECFLTSTAQNRDKRRLCELACQNGTAADTCLSTSEFGHKVGLPPGGILLRPGSPCDNFQGYCDVFFKCRAVDAEGPLARLKNMLFNKAVLNSLAMWIQENWWACMLIGIAFIIFMGVFIKCCAVHTPSSNPKKPPARRFSETLRRPIHTLRRMRHHGHHGHSGQSNRGAPAGGHTSGGGGAGAPQRAGPSRGPAHGYGEGRGQYYAPKATAPPRPELYAGAYTDRNAFHMRQQKV